MHEEPTERVIKNGSRMCGTVKEYYDAMSGKGPHAYDWADKPHRLVYDLLGEIEHLHALTAPQAETCEMSPQIRSLLASITGINDPSEMAADAVTVWQIIQKDAAELLKADRATWSRPWTRKDGSTTPRGDVVDRRESAGGGDWNWEIAGRRVGDSYGRRSGDAARWTVQETPQTLVKPQPDTMHGYALECDTLPEWVEAFAAHIDYVIQWRLRELDRRSVK